MAGVSWRWEDGGRNRSPFLRQQIVRRTGIPLHVSTGVTYRILHIQLDPQRVQVRLDVVGDRQYSIASA